MLWPLLIMATAFKVYFAVACCLFVFEMKYCHESVQPNWVKQLVSDEIDMQEFFYMDGKWMFVWGSYAITAILMTLGFVYAYRRKKKLLAEIEESLEE